MTKGSAKYEGAERRGRLRLHAAFPVTVQGTDKDGRNFKVDTLTENVSANGICLKLPQEIREGAELAVVIRFYLGAASGVRVATNASVVRVESADDQSFRVGATFSQYTFLD